MACVGDDGIVRVFATAAGGEWDTVLSCHLSLQSTVEGVKEEPTNVVGVVIHPTGRHVFVVTSNGKIHFLSITKQKSEEGGEELQIAIAATFEDTSAAASEVECSCISLHPDGLILAIGRSDGQVALWDLKTQQLASVLEVCYCFFVWCMCTVLLDIDMCVMTLFLVFLAAYCWCIFIKFLT